MNERITRKVRMELLSDAIFGAGYSIPGGEDISVYTDRDGYPYFKASSLKGILRESLRNLLAWTETGTNRLNDLLGVSGYAGVDQDSRVFLSDLALTAKPMDPAACFYRRTFTKIKNGTVESGTLREAMCIRRGLVFEGEMSCLEQDADLLAEALGLIKLVGTSRNRGFGSVRITTEQSAAGNAVAHPGAAACIRYVLRAELPLIITKLSSSAGNDYEPRSYIPGSALRGLVAGNLSRRDPVWFGEHKDALLSDSTRFMNALPRRDGHTPIPSLMGFYENKKGENFESVVIKGEPAPDNKRAKVGSFCAPVGDTLFYWSTDTDGCSRIDCHPSQEDGKRKMFGTRHISAGQEFEGYILLDDPAMAEKICEAIDPVIWLGADRYSGFGRCRVLALEAVGAPACFDAYGHPADGTPGGELYMTALSPLTMLNDKGEPCGLELDSLARALGVDSVEIINCSTSVSEYGGYNRTWACREPAVRMYDSGSVFRLKTEPAPTAVALRRVQTEGVGIRRAEGFGSVLFLRDYERIARKQELERPAEDQRSSTAARVRRSRLRWIMQTAPTLQSKGRDGLSPSQIGTLQALAEKAVANQDPTAGELMEYLSSQHGLNAAKERKYKQIYGLIRDILHDPLPATLDEPAAEDDDLDKLRLICDLFNFTRKIKRGE